MIQVEKKKLLTALVMSQKVAGNVKSADPPRVHLEVNGADVIIRATGESLDLQMTVPAFGSLGFSAAASVGIHPDGIISFVRKAGQDDVSVGIVDGALHVQVGKVTAKFTSTEGLPPIAWPAVREVGSVNSSDLITALSRVKVAVSTRAGGQAAFRGVLLEAKGNALYVTATDGQQLAIQGVPWSGAEGRFLIHGSDMNTLIGALAAQGDETLKVFADDGNLMLSGQVLARLRLMDHLAFLNVHTVIPKGAPAAVEVDATQLKLAVTSACAVHEGTWGDVELSGVPGRGLSVAAAGAASTGRVMVEGATVHQATEVVTHARMLQLATQLTGTVTISVPTQGNMVMLRSGAFLAIVARRVGVKINAPAFRDARTPAPTRTPDAPAPWENPAAPAAPAAAWE